MKCIKWRLVDLAISGAVVTTASTTTTANDAVRPIAEHDLFQFQ